MMKKLNFIICLLILLPCIPVIGQESELNKFFDQWTDSTILQPGISVALIKNKELVYKKTFGYANLEYEIPLQNKSVFDIASLAKQFTGFAIAKLIIDKKLKLDEAVAPFFPELEFLDKGILIKHLVYHTSGLRDVGELFDLSYVGGNFTSKEALEIIKNQRSLNFPTGTEYDYSNTNYVLLALIVERVSGITFREWCHTDLFTPLKMEDSFVNDNPLEIIEDRAVAYYSTPINFSFQQDNGMSLIGSSAVYSTIDDMVVWIKALQEEMVFPEVFKLMKTKGALDDGREINYGFGLSFSSFKNETMIEHTGATPAGFRSVMAIFPDQSLSIVMLSNWGDINPIADYGINLINQFLPSTATDQDKIPEVKVNKTEIALTKELANRYIGSYLFNNEIHVKIDLNQEGSLTVQLEGQSEKPLIPISETEFELPALKSKLHFICDSAKVCQKVEVWMNGQKEGELSRVKVVDKSSVNHDKYVGQFYSDELQIVFNIGLSEDQLILENTKRGKVVLHHKNEKVYIPENGIASSIIFNCNEQDEVTGFLLNRGSRLRNLKFVKLMDKL